MFLLLSIRKPQLFTVLSLLGMSDHICPEEKVKLCLLFLRRIQSTLYCGNSLGKGSVHQNRSPSWILRIWKWKCLYSAFYCHVHWIDPLVRFSPRVAMSVCLSVCLSVPSPTTHFRVLWRLLVKERIPNIGLWWHNFQKQRACNFFTLKKLEKLVKLVGGGSVINGAYPV